MTESMTEITKALRCCADSKCGECNRLNNGIREDYVCSNDLHKDAANTIDRLTAENAYMRGIYQVVCDRNKKLTAELTDYRALAAEYGIDGKTMLTLAKSQIETAKENAKLTERLDRLRELVAAERDGRVVVLPCKVGDTVYAIVHCDEVMKDYDDDYVTGTGAITCPFEDACVYEECDDSNEMIVETCVSGFWQEGEGTWKVFFEHINADIGASDFGKTVFLTRAEAEAKGEQE